jgi:hypothetical protein
MMVLINIDNIDQLSPIIGTFLNFIFSGWSLNTYVSFRVNTKRILNNKGALVKLGSHPPTPK